MRIVPGLAWFTYIGTCMLVFACVEACGGSSSADVLPQANDGGTADGTTGDAGVGSDAEPPLPDGSVVADASGADGAGPGGDATTLPCGAASCTIPSQTCCVSPPAPYGYACMNGSSCPGGATALKCSSSANCAVPSVCCISSSGEAASSSCKATCSAGEKQMCDPNAATSGCPNGKTCANPGDGDFPLPETYAVCN